MAQAIVNLNTWTGVVPVILPWGEPTIASVGIASAGVAVPFFCYVIAMFMVIVPIWMNNFENDKQFHQEAGGDNINLTAYRLSKEEQINMSMPGVEFLPPDLVTRVQSRSGGGLYEE